MGSGRWDPGAWAGYTTSRSYATKSASAIYTSRTINADLDPRKIKLRESRDSADNPNSTAVAVALDVTGSMDAVLESIAKKGLNTLVTEIYNRKPVTDPHVMCMAIGDIECDAEPLQATQFEADIRIAEQLEKLYLERGGGGNAYESYALAWWFAANRTGIDCFDKRKRKGYLFTIGDEGPTPKLKKADMERVGLPVEADIDRDELLSMVSRQWEVFHLIVAEGDFARTHPDHVRQKWTDLLGQRAIWLADHTKMAEVIVSLMQIREGHDAEEVVESWDGTTSLVVREAMKGMTKRSGASGELVTL